MPQALKQLPIATLDINTGIENVLELTEFGIGMEAVGNKIIVLIDSFRSGYECKTCGGFGRVLASYRCKCDPLDWSENTHPPRGIKDRFNNPCNECGGDYLSKRTADKEITCPTCKGKGATLVIPDTVKSLPTTGVVLSVGPEVTKIKVGYRIVATPYSGTFMPMKGGAPIKVYTEHEPLAYIYNIKDNTKAKAIENNKIKEIGSESFYDLDTPLGKEYSH